MDPVGRCYIVFGYSHFVSCQSSDASLATEKLNMIIVHASDLCVLVAFRRMMPIPQNIYNWNLQSHTMLECLIRLFFILVLPNNGREVCCCDLQRVALPGTVVFRPAASTLRTPPLQTRPHLFVVGEKLVSCSLRVAHSSAVNIVYLPFFNALYFQVL
jgi:hypothetical protein